MRQKQIYKAKHKETHRERQEREEQETRETQQIPEERSENDTEKVEGANEALDDIDRVLGELVLANVGGENPGNN